MPPDLYIVSRPQLTTRELQRFLDDHHLTWRETAEASEGESLVELAGRLCYLSFSERQSPRTNEQYIRNLLDRGHDSVLEHASWSFILTGVSRAFTHQLVRHRVGMSYSQLSQQYHTEESASFVEPRAVREDPDLSAVWHSSIRQALEAYRALLKAIESRPHLVSGDHLEARRLIRSAARSVLPEATETKILVTANARAIRHFLDLRGSIAGDEEMRAVCVLLLTAVRTDSPAIFADFVIEEHEDGLHVRRAGPV